MDISKYVTNKDIKITNDDIDIEKLTNELRKGYIEEKEADVRIKNELATSQKKNSADYAELETKYNDLEKRNADLTSRNQTLALEKVMVEKGFKNDQFGEITKLRNSLFSEEKDDEKAIQSIKEKFGKTYFPETTKIPEVPNEAGIKRESANEKPIDIKVTRNTKISDLFISKK